MEKQAALMQITVFFSFVYSFRFGRAMVFMKNVPSYLRAHKFTKDVVEVE